MRALVCEALGPLPASVALREVDAPRAGPGQLVVDVKAAGVNFPDLLVVQGLYQLRPPLPFSPGGELAGVVREAGEGVEGFVPGDRVMALTGFGAFAEQVALAPSQCVPMPDAMPFDEAGGFLLTYCTAHHALVDRGRLAAGETLLVLGAAGGVGVAAVQLGKALGARVIAAASTEDKRAFCRAQGADDAIDPAGDLKATLKRLGGVDVVFDPVGADLAEPALRALRPRGRFLVIGFAGGAIPKLALNLPLLKECDVVGVQWGAFAMREPERQRALTADLLRLYGEGKVRPPVHARVPLADGVRALEELSSRRAMGKVVLVP